MYCISRDDPFAYLLFAMFSEDYFWPIQFPLTGSLKLKIGHIVLVLTGRRYCGLMSLEQSDPSKIGEPDFF